MHQLRCRWSLNQKTTFFRTFPFFFLNLHKNYSIIPFIYSTISLNDIIIFIFSSFDILRILFIISLSNGLIFLISCIHLLYKSLVIWFIILFYLQSLFSNDPPPNFASALLSLFPLNIYVN